MPSKKPEIKRVHTVKHYWKVGLLVVLTLILLGVIGYFAKAWYQGHQFRQVEARMDKLQASFVETLGKPIYQSKDESCGYSSVVYGQGRLSCGFSNTLTYIGDRATLLKLTTKAQLITENSNDIKISYTKPPTDNWKPGDIVDYPSNTLQTDIPNTSCEVTYSLYNYRNLPEVIKQLDVSRNDLYLRIASSCSNNPLRPIFPVKES